MRERFPLCCSVLPWIGPMCTNPDVGVCEDNATARKELTPLSQKDYNCADAGG